MRSVLKFCGIVFLLGGTALGQSAAQADAARQERERRQDLNDRMKAMRELTDPERERDSMRRDPDEANSRTSAQWERTLKEARKVDPEITARFRAFLDQKKTGIFTLLPNSDCATSLTIRVAGGCEGFVPESSDFSFRTRKYADPTFHDLSLRRDHLVTKGFFSHGLFLSLGNVPIEGVNLQTPQIRALSAMDVAGDLRATRQTSQRLISGFESAGFRFSNQAEVAIDKTYAMKVVAYGLKNLVPLNGHPRSKIHRNFGRSLFGDRDMIIVVFRIVDVEPSGKLTILWKELAREDAPKLRFGKGEEWTDIWP